MTRAAGSVGFAGSNEDDGVGVMSWFTIDDALSAGGVTFSTGYTDGFVFNNLVSFGHKVGDGIKWFTTKV